MREDTEIPGAHEPIELAGAGAESPVDGMKRDEELRLVEAILFAAAEPVSETAIARRLGEDADVVGLLNTLADRYATRGVNVVKVGDKWTLRTAPDLAPRLKFETQVPRKLSRAAVETMAIVAYHQPVTRAEIEEIRGVVISRGTLESLMEAGWIKPGRRREVPGRPGTWVTTDTFLSHFGLERLEDLPGMSELRAAGLLDARPVSMPALGRDRAEDETGDEEAGDEEAGDVDSTDATAAAESSGHEPDEGEPGEGDAGTERLDHLVEGAIEK